MKKKIMVIGCSLLLAMAAFSFVEEEQQSDPNISAYEFVNANEKFKLSRDLFNNEANKGIRAKKLADQEAAETKRKADEAQDKGEGQIKVRF